MINFNFSSAEQRLLRYNISDFEDPASSRTSNNRINRREAQNNVQRQNEARQSRVAMNQAQYSQKATIIPDSGGRYGTGYVGEQLPKGYDPRSDSSRPDYDVRNDPNAAENSGPAFGQNWTDTYSQGATIPGYRSTYDSKFRNYEQEANAAADAAEQRVGGNRASTEDRTAARQQAMANYYKQIEVEQQRQSAQRQKEANTAGSQPETSPLGASLQAALAGLSPEEQALLSPILQNIDSDFATGISQNQESGRAMLQGGYVNGVYTEGLNPVKQKLEQEIETMKETRGLVKDQLDSISEQIREDNERLISLQERAAAERLQWNELQQRRSLDKQKNETHQSMIVQFALNNGFGQIGNLAAVEASDQMFESKIRDLQMEVGMQRTDLAAKFTGLYVQNNNEYRAASMKNLEDYVSSLERLTTQGQTNTVNFLTASQNILKGMMEKENTLREKRSTKLENLASTMLDQVNKAREIKAKEERDAADREFDLYKLNFDRDIELMKAGSSLDDKALARMDRITQQLSGRINNDPVVRDYKTTKSHFSTLEAAFKDAEKQAGKNFTDQALINSFNKLTDPNSVVRESEFNRSAAGLGLVQNLYSKFLKNAGVVKVDNADGSTTFQMGVGGTLTPAARKELYDVASTINTSRLEAYNENLGQYQLQLDTYNASVPDEYMLDPENFNLPSSIPVSTFQSLEQMAPEGLFPTGNPYRSQTPIPKTTNVTEDDLISAKIGNRNITGQPYLVQALELANAAFQRETGNSIIVAESHRSRDRQAKLYAASQAGQIGRAAPPGKSFHELGLALDIVNWKEAEPYLRRYGLLNELPDDKGHFSIGEFYPIS